MMLWKINVRARTLVQQLRPCKTARTIHGCFVLAEKTVPKLFWNCYF